MHDPAAPAEFPALSAPVVSAEAVLRAHRVRGVVLDVDGVLTDGGIYLLPDGEEIKRFDARDGLGIRLLQEAGLPVALLTSRYSKAVLERAKELRIEFVHHARGPKADALPRLLEEMDLAAGEIAYLGDDLLDLEVLRRVGLPAVVADAAPEVKAAALWISGRWGGRGAAREFAEFILRTQGRWEETVERVVSPRQANGRPKGT